MNDIVWTIGMLCIANFPCVSQVWIEPPQEYPTEAVCLNEFQYLPPPAEGTKWICRSEPRRCTWTKNGCPPGPREKHDP